MEHSLAGIFWRLAGVLALVFANGFFVAAEFAIVTVRKTRIDQLIAEGPRSARAVRRAITDPDSYIAATQLGITMASIGLGWIGEPALASLIQPAVRIPAGAVAEATAHSLAVAIAFAIDHGAAHHAGRARAKDHRASARRDDGAARREADRALHAGVLAVHPPAERRGPSHAELIGMRAAEGHAMVHSEEELKMLVTASQEAGVLEEQEEQMLHRVFDFADLTAGQAMVPRTELVAIAGDASGDALLEQIGRGGYSVFPVYRDDMDNVVGILHAIDVIKAIAAGRKRRERRGNCA